MRFSNFRKLLLLLSLLILCLLATLAGILPGSAQERTLGVMVWSWSPEVDEALDRAVTEFEESYGESYGVKIHLIWVPASNYLTKLQTSVMAGMSLPDLLWVKHVMVAPLVDEEYIIDLDRFVADRPELIKGLPDAVLKRFRYKDHLHGIPLGAEGEFALSAYAISSMARESGNVDVALELIMFLRTKIPPPLEIPYKR